MCFTFTPESLFVRVGVSLEGDASYFDVSKLMWRTARSDKGILSLFMPPFRHFNLEMLNILICFFFSPSFSADCRFNSYIMLSFFFSPQRTAQQAKERSQMRKSAAASKVASDISRFFIRKWSGGLVRVTRCLNLLNQIESSLMWFVTVWMKTHHDSSWTKLTLKEHYVVLG